MYLLSVLRNEVVHCFNTILYKSMDMGTALDPCDTGCNSYQMGISGTMEAYLLERIGSAPDRHHRQEAGSLVHLLKLTDGG